MKPGVSLKSVARWFLVVLALYAGIFYGIEHWRHQKGAWEVHFNTDAQGSPSIVVYQPRLNISSAEIVFVGEQVAASNLTQKVWFDRPLRSLPFGKVIYEDLTVLPGVVTFDLFGHEIELLPRVLFINRQEIPWKPDMVVELSETNKPSLPPRPPAKHRARLERAP